MVLLDKVKNKARILTSSKRNLILLVCFTILVCGCLFWVLAAPEKETFTVTAESVQFHEQFKPVNKSNDTFDYFVTAKNEDKEKDYYVRIRLDSSMPKAERSKFFEKHLNKKYWEKDGEYFYYTDALNAGSTTEPLLLNVETDDSFLIDGDTIKAQGESVPDREYGSYQDAFNLKGKE